MKIFNKNITLHLLVFSTPLWNAVCGDKCEMTGKTYQFQIPISIINYKDTVKVGDTIKVLVTYNSRAVVNLVNNRTEDLRNFKFTPHFYFYDLNTKNTDSFFRGLLNMKFKILGQVDIAYSIDDNYASITQYKHNINDNNIVADSILLIPQVKGIYHFVYDATNDVYRGQTFPGKCPRTTYKLFPIYDKKISNERLTQYLKFAKITSKNQFMDNTNPEFFSFGFCVKER